MKNRAITTALLGCLLTICHAQAPTTPLPVPPAPPAETGPDVDLLHHLRRSTVSLGIRVPDGHGGTKFQTVGSGVIVAWDAQHGCLLTAKHIFFDPTKSFFPTALYIRLPQSEPRATDDLGVELPLQVSGRRLWHGAEDDADLAVIALPNLSAYKDLHGISLADFGGEEDVYQGASVVVMGYPELAGPDYQTTPIARGGIVAWTNPNGRLDHTFLVDANVFSGNSGGPVFHTSGGLTRTGSFSIGGSPKLIGIVSKDAWEDAQVHVGEQNVTITNQQTGVTLPMTAKVLNIGGIGVVEPASKAKKLITDTFYLGNPPTH
jgi:S1-C subfamily serine protease